MMYEIKDSHGNMLAKSRHFKVLRDECDKLARERKGGVKMYEVETIRKEKEIYSPPANEWN